MNQDDKKKATGLLGRLQELKALMEQIEPELRELADAERAKYDNLSEGLQNAEQGQKISDAADRLEEAAEELEMGHVTEAVEALEQLELT